MTDRTTSEHIQAALRDLESHESVRVLFACESGSRAWDFASPDSDYDVRFIYAHPAAWYLGLEEQRNTIEQMLPGDLDLAGWELRKALRLLMTSNASLFEWIGSHTVYAQDTEFTVQLRDLAQQYFSPRATAFHYTHLADRTARKHLSGETANIKKLFYVLRPLLASQWILTNGTVPPTSYIEQLEAGLLPKDVEDACRALLDTKSESLEGDDIAVPDGVRKWIQESLATMGQRASELPLAARSDWAPLNALARTWIQP